MYSEKRKIIDKTYREKYPQKIKQNMLSKHEKAMFSLTEKIAYDKGKKAGYARKERELERETEDMIENSNKKKKAKKKKKTPKKKQTFKKKKKEKIIEICRSFSQKLNTGNYTTADFFASFKQEALESEAVEVSEKLLKFAQDEVEKSVNNFKVENI